MDKQTVSISAPGKVLFTGGFLVLDRRHTGLVLGLDARIHAHVETWPGTDRVSDGEVSHILVQSPQFRDARWLYEVNPSNGRDGHAVSVTQVQRCAHAQAYTQTPNTFVATTLQYVLTYLQSRRRSIHGHVRITILADDGYYSSSSSAATRPKIDGFSDFGVGLNDAHKTGLGSSAALVSSLTAALVAFYTDETTHIPPSTVVHNLAQAAHCAAQGKIGSGFDIAAAVYGPCVYRRFSPSILEAVGEPVSAGFAERLRICVDDLSLEQQWDVEISSNAVQIPPALLLLMCDVDCGSETPSLVRRILAWRKEHPAEAGRLWHAIQQGSDDLCHHLQTMSHQSSLRRDQQEELTNIIATIRSFVRDMSRQADVPVEPQVITDLLDYCTALPGVIGGVAPGAGGYDAVALLVKNDVDTVQHLRERLSDWKAQEDDLGVTVGKVQLLDVKQAYHGLMLEDCRRYQKWL